MSPQTWRKLFYDLVDLIIDAVIDLCPINGMVSMIWQSRQMNSYAFRYYLICTEVLTLLNTIGWLVEKGCAVYKLLDWCGKLIDKCRALPGTGDVVLLYAFELMLDHFPAYFRVRFDLDMVRRIIDMYFSRPPASQCSVWFVTFMFKLYVRFVPDIPTPEECEDISEKEFKQRLLIYLQRSNVGKYICDILVSPEMYEYENNSMKFDINKICLRILKSLSKLSRTKINWSLQGTFC